MAAALAGPAMADDADGLWGDLYTGTYTLVEGVNEDNILLQDKPTTVALNFEEWTLTLPNVVIPAWSDTIPAPVDLGTLVIPDISWTDLSETVKYIGIDYPHVDLPGYPNSSYGGALRLNSETKRLYGDIYINLRVGPKKVIYIAYKLNAFYDKTVERPETPDEPKDIDYWEGTYRVAQYDVPNPETLNEDIPATVSINWTDWVVTLHDLQFSTAPGEPMVNYGPLAVEDINWFSLGDDIMATWTNGDCTINGTEGHYVMGNAYISGDSNDVTFIVYLSEDVKVKINFLGTESNPVGMNGINAQKGVAKYFDLRGNLVKDPQHGIYVKVQDGKATKVKI